MFAQLRFDGNYYSGPVPWEEWHVGVRMHGIHFRYRRYYPNGDWLGCYRDHEFSFWEFTETVTPELFADAKHDRAPRIGNADPLCTAGSYTIFEDVLVEVFVPDWTGDWTWEFKYQILENRLRFPDSGKQLLFQSQA